MSIYMARLNKESLLTPYELQGMGGDFRIKVMIPIKSTAYQAFLAANREYERLREENGGPTLEGQTGIIEATKRLDAYAKTLIKEQKRN